MSFYPLASQAPNLSYPCLTRWHCGWPDLWASLDHTHPQPGLGQLPPKLAWSCPPHVTSCQAQISSPSFPLQKASWVGDNLQHGVAPRCPWNRVLTPRDDPQASPGAVPVCIVTASASLALLSLACWPPSWLLSHTSQCPINETWVCQLSLML